MQRKAKAGHVTGGRVFGYDNVEVLGPGRAAVARRAADQRSGGRSRPPHLRAVRRRGGSDAITKTLNAEGAPSPRAQQGRPPAWAASSVREVLLPAVYRGEIVWNQTRKRDSWGQQRSEPRPATDWLRVPAPDLRIVSDDLWSDGASEIGRASGTERPYAGIDRRGQHDCESRYLLTSFARCSQCGGS